MSKLKFNYDDKYDILYVSIGRQVPSYDDEVSEGIILRRDINTDKITGVTILGFMKKLSNHDSSLDTIPVNIDFSLFKNKILSM